VSWHPTDLSETRRHATALRAAGSRHSDKRERGERDDPDGLRLWRERQLGKCVIPKDHRSMDDKTLYVRVRAPDTFVLLHSAEMTTRADCIVFMECPCAYALWRAGAVIACGRTAHTAPMRCLVQGVGGKRKLCSAMHGAHSANATGGLVHADAGPRSTIVRWAQAVLERCPCAHAGGSCSATGGPQLALPASPTVPVCLKRSGERVDVDVVTVGTKPADILYLLKFYASASEIFKFPKHTVVTESNAMVVKVPSEAGFIPVTLLHCLGQEEEVFADTQQKELDCEELTGASVTPTGQPRFTSALVEPPSTEDDASGLLERILSHPALSFLTGVECILVEKREDAWVRLTAFNPKEPPKQLGIVVRRQNVRVVDLMFGGHAIPSVLRQDPGVSLLDAVKRSCDWRAWLAVNALPGNVALVEAGGFIHLPGPCGNPHEQYSERLTRRLRRSLGLSYEQSAHGTLSAAADSHCRPDTLGIGRSSHQSTRSWENF
jgi:hypothetical protein